MIKTMSFAPPRAATSRSGAKKAPRIEKKSAASGSSSPAVQTSLDFSAPDVASAPTPLAAPKVAVAKPEVKARKPRVPKDLATQYGEKTTTRSEIVPPVAAESPKKRLSKTEREARRALIKPSEGLLERLARANQVSNRKPIAAPRGKGWKFECGRCGATSYFETPGGLCGCGTIAVKE